MADAERQPTPSPKGAGPGGRPMTASERASHAALVRWGKKQPLRARLEAIRLLRKKAKAKSGKGKAKKPKVTPEQRAAEKEKKQAENRAAIAETQGVEGAEALSAFASGGELDSKQARALFDAGLVSTNDDGSFRMSPAGRQWLNAANRGDAGAARDALAAGKDKAAAEREKAAEEEKEKEPAAGGGGGGGSKKPTPEEKKEQQRQEREKTAAATAPKVGLRPQEVSSLRAAAEGGKVQEAEIDGLAQQGLVEADGKGGFRATDQGRRALTALERGDVRQFRAAVEDAESRLGREEEKETREAERATEQAARDEERATRAKEKEAARQLREETRAARQARIQDRGLAKLDKGGKLSDATLVDLEEAGLISFDKDDKPVLTLEGRKRLEAKKGKPPTTNAGGYTGKKSIPEIAEDAHPGAMVCLVIPEAIRALLRGIVRGAEADHLTLCFLAPDASAIEEHKGALLQGLSEIAQYNKPVAGVLGGAARFNASQGSDGKDVLVALFDSPGLPDLRDAVARAVVGSGIEPPSDHGFIPHITLSYVDTDARTPNLKIPREPFTVDALTLIWAGERIDLPFFVETKAMDFQIILEQITDAADALADEGDEAVKAGARHNRGDMGLVQSIYDEACAIAELAVQLGASEEMDEGEETEETPDEDYSGKSQQTFGGKKRDDLPDSDFAGPNRTFPIVTAADVSDAASLIGKADDPEAVKRKIIAIAKRKGFPLPKAWEETKKSVEQLQQEELTALAASGQAIQGTPQGDIITVSLPDFLIGDEVKALAGDFVGAYAIRFGSADEPDMSHMRDYFTKSTDFWLDAWDRRPMLYHHAMDEDTLDAPRIGTWTKAEVKDEGIWLEGQLDKSHRYYSAIKELVRRGVLRLSSDSAPHLVRREAKGHTHEVTRWPLLAASLTPTPAEPRLQAVSFKALLDALGVLEGIDDNPEAEDQDSDRSDATKAIEDRKRWLLLELDLLSLEATIA